jgi:hypothetical protein
LSRRVFLPSIDQESGLNLGGHKTSTTGWKSWLVAAALVFFFSTGAHAECVKWSAARGIISSQGLMPPAQVRSRAMKRGGKVLSMDLCRRGKHYVYRLTVIGQAGRVRNMVADGRSGSVVSAGGRKNNRLKQQIRSNRRKGKNFKLKKPKFKNKLKLPLPHTMSGKLKKKFKFGF